MTPDFDTELGTIRDELVRMTRLVGTAMNCGTQALLDADLTLAEAVIAADARIDTMANDVEQRCFDLITDSAPTPDQLRVVIGSLRIAASLERMGDLAEHVAKQSRLRYPRTSVPRELRATFAEMGDLAEAILTTTGAMIGTDDVDLAEEVAGHDDRIDALHRGLFAAVLAPTWEHGVEVAVDVTLLSRYYERYGDHAVSVARRVVTMVTGAPYVGVVLESAR